MTDTSSSLSLPYILPSQAQKHVTHNEALRILDVLVQLAVETDDQTAPPTVPENGARFIVGAVPTGAWAGHAREVAVYQDNAWQFFTPKVGWRAYVSANEALVVHDGIDWMELDSAEVQDLEAFGLGMIAPASTPFSAKLNAALWTALYAADGGDGHMVQSLNKENAGSDAGFVLQDNFSTRGLFGLFGSNALRLATSPDGTTFKDGLVIDTATGVVAQPNLPRFKAHTNYDNFCTADTWTKIATNVAEYNDQACFDAATNLFTAPVDGSYMVGGTLVFKQDASDMARMSGRLVLNGAAEILGGVGGVTGPHEDAQTVLTLQTMVSLAAGDTVELQCMMRGFDGYALADHSGFWGYIVG